MLYFHAVSLVRKTVLRARNDMMAEPDAFAIRRVLYVSLQFFVCIWFSIASKTFVCIILFAHACAHIKPNVSYGAQLIYAVIPNFKHACNAFVVRLPGFACIQPSGVLAKVLAYKEFCCLQPFS